LAANQSNHVRILVVEDERIIARDIQSSLENLGYAVLAIAPSGTEAIEKALELRPDLILMDIRLKGEIDGIQAAEQIWNQLQIPIIYSTGYSDRNTLERAKTTGPFGYILKPIEERELYVTIETALHRYRLDRELQEKEQWLSTILKGIGDGVIAFDAQGYVRFLNPIAETLTGWQQQEALGRTASEVFQLIHEQTRTPIDNPVMVALQSGVRVHLAEFTSLIARNGTEIPIDDSASALTDENGLVTGAVVVFRDVTQRRLAEERNLALERAQQLELQMTELQRLSQLKDDFLSTVSHELRTPLANIKMAIQMLEIVLNQRGLLALEDSTESIRLSRYLEILRSQCEQELTLVNDLLDLQRLNADAYFLNLTEIQLQDWIPSIAESFQERAENRQQILQIDVSPDLPPLISDLSSITRIVSELLNNACKYTPPGERITVVVRPVGIDPDSAESSGSELVELVISNTGAEIAEPEQSRIFEPFYRIPGHDHWQQGGTGLGLALVKKMVTYLNGTIRLESGFEQTSFIIKLPMQLSLNPADEDLNH
jgi:PAS domain S-box-containing protein